MNIIDQWYQANGAETLSEFASTRSEMDHLACHTIDQEWLAYEGEQAMALVVEKSKGVIFDSLMPRFSSGATTMNFNPYYQQQQMQQQILQQHGLLRGIGGALGEMSLPW